MSPAAPGRFRPLPVPIVRNTVRHGDCVPLMRRMDAASVDFILTDPPYICRYRDRAGRQVANDDNARWLEPAFAEMFRLLKPDSFAVSFYGWHQVDRFMHAWRQAGFRVVGHLVFPKAYPSSTRFLEHRHEQAYLLAKGDPRTPAEPLPDVRAWAYTGNRLHPTQKPLEALQPLVRAFCPEGGLVLDPFCGSGSSLEAARREGRDFLGIELDHGHYTTACRRVGFSRPGGPRDRMAPEGAFFMRAGSKTRNFVLDLWRGVR